MLRFAKLYGALAALVLAFQSALGFSLLGPIVRSDTWQVGTIGYNLSYDIGGPKNLGEEYRWNTPNIYYGFDQSFLDFFGSNGVFAVERAFSILNNLTNFTSYSRELSEFPLESQRINRRAQALHLIDVKSMTLHLVLEELGLTEADRYVWTLRRRDPIAGLSCPFMFYTVIERNFDPVTWEPSSYVNGNLFSYEIFEFCTGPDPLADAVEFPADPDSQEFSAVMSSDGLAGSLIGVLRYGSFVTGLSRDDVGGLRYIYRTNNMNVEAVSDDSLEFHTNLNAQLLVSSNLTLLAAQALTNNAAALQTLYPGLVVASSSNTFTVLRTTNVTAYFTNFPWSPPFSFPTLAFITNIALSPQILFQHTFGNIVTFRLVNGNWVAVPITSFSSSTGHVISSIQTTVVTNAPWSVPGGTNGIVTVLVTNNFTRLFATNQVTGEFFILPPNFCDVAIIAPLLTNVVFNTNVLLSVTNITGTNGESFTQSLVDTFTNHIFVIYPVICDTNTLALRQGMDRFKFLRTSYDSLLGRFFQPITNVYSLVEITNSTPFTNWFQRVVTAPDFLFSAADLESLPSSVLRTITTSNFNSANALPGLAGPGNIQPHMQIVFSKVGPPLDINIYDPIVVLNGLSQISSATNFIWASYDGTTNDPILYPQGTSIVDLENQVLFQIISPVLPDGYVGAPYSAQLQVSQIVSQPPYVWTLAPASPPLPPGLTLASDGTISGTPQAVGAYVFVAKVTDAGSHTTARTISITIHL